VEGDPPVKDGTPLSTFNFRLFVIL
jgi:hypothetical protein